MTLLDRICRALRDHGPMTVGELAEHLGARRGSVGMAVYRQRKRFPGFGLHVVGHIRPDKAGGVQQVLAAGDGQDVRYVKVRR